MNNNYLLKYPNKYFFNKISSTKLFIILNFILNIKLLSKKVDDFFRPFLLYQYQKRTTDYCFYIKERK